MKSLKYCLFPLLASLFFQANARTSNHLSAVSLYDLFQIGGTSYPVEMTGSPPTSSLGAIQVQIYSDFIIKDEKFPNILIFDIIGTYNNSTGKYDITSTSFADPESELGPIGSNYPKPWDSEDLKSSAFAAKRYYVNNDWQRYNTSQVFNDLMGSSLPIKITIVESDAELISLKLPGIGEVYANNRVSETLRFDPLHPCRNSDNTNPICAEWIGLKNPPENLDSVDIKFAAHRGFWGFDLGRGPVENTAPSIAAALPYTNIIESDIMITADKQVVVSHDYNLQRLTNYSGPDPDNTFIYDLNFDQIKNLYLRRRNFDVSTYQFVQLTDLLNYMKQYKTILHIDIKEKAPRRNPITGECTAACDMNAEKRLVAWNELFGKIFDVTDREDAWDYVGVKTPYTVNTMKTYMPQSQYRNMSRILYFPVIYPSLTTDEVITRICDWYNNAPNLLMGLQTGFKSDSSPALQPCEVEHLKYSNILEFVAVRTRLRPGVYPEEPMGPKGIVDRYAQWLFKNLATDFRGDHFWLMNIPFFRTSILTTDRPDLWQKINNIYQN